MLRCGGGGGGASFSDWILLVMPFLLAPRYSIYIKRIVRLWVFHIFLILQRQTGQHGGGDGSGDVDSWCQWGYSEQSSP